MFVAVVVSIERDRETGRPIYTFPTKTADLYYILRKFSIYKLMFGVLLKRLPFQIFFLLYEYFYYYSYSL